MSDINNINLENSNMEELYKEIYDIPNTNINKTDDNGNTLLHIVVTKNYPYNTLFTLLLIYKKIDINIKNNENKTALNIIESFKGTGLKIYDEIYEILNFKNNILKDYSNKLNIILIYLYYNTFENNCMDFIYKKIAKSKIFENVMFEITENIKLKTDKMDENIVYNNILKQLKSNNTLNLFISQAVDNGLSILFIDIYDNFNDYLTTQNNIYFASRNKSFKIVDLYNLLLNNIIYSFKIQLMNHPISNFVKENLEKYKDRLGEDNYEKIEKEDFNYFIDNEGKENCNLSENISEFEKKNIIKILENYSINGGNRKNKKSKLKKKKLKQKIKNKKTKRKIKNKKSIRKLRR